VMTVDKFRDFVRKLQTSGKPPKVDLKYIKSLGYKSSNDERFPKPLKFIGLIDGSGVPTDRFAVLRDKEAGKVRMGSYIKEAYADLYSVYDDAHKKGAQALANFFSANTEVGERAVGAMVATFQALCEFASFGEAEPLDKVQTPIDTSAKRPEPPRDDVRPVEIHVSIQLSIPPTTDSEVYDKLFASMAKHIIKLKEGQPWLSAERLNVPIYLRRTLTASYHASSPRSPARLR